MRGEFQFTYELLNDNILKWDQFDILNHHLLYLSSNEEASLKHTFRWYAYQANYFGYTFKYADEYERITQNYLDILKRDGWIINKDYAVSTKPDINTFLQLIYDVVRHNTFEDFKEYIKLEIKNYIEWKLKF